MTPTLLFVHSPVVGPATWSSTAEVLRGKGFRCDVPDMTALATSGGPYYPKFAAAAAAAVDGDSDPVVVVGHSAAGALLPAIAESVGGRVLGARSSPTQCSPSQGAAGSTPRRRRLRDQLRGMAEAGRLPPWHEWFPPGALDGAGSGSVAAATTVTAEIPRLPLAYFEEPAPATTPVQRCAFLRFSTPYDHAADDAERLGWWVARRDWDHLRMLTAPDAVADLIASAISALRAG